MRLKLRQWTLIQFFSFLFVIVLFQNQATAELTQTSGSKTPFKYNSITFVMGERAEQYYYQINSTINRLLKANPTFEFETIEINNLYCEKMAYVGINEGDGLPETRFKHKCRFSNWTGPGVYETGEYASEILMSQLHQFGDLKYNIAAETETLYFIIPKIIVRKVVKESVVSYKLIRPNKTRYDVSYEMEIRI